MSAPKRIQRKRTKGWRMPEGAVYVGRPTRWGNPARVERTGHVSRPWEAWAGDVGPLLGGFDTAAEARAEAVAWFRRWLDSDGVVPKPFTEAASHAYVTAHDRLTVALRDDIAAIRGRDLACWCPLDQPCHADVLLEIANRPAHLDNQAAAAERSAP